jgi:radical SAM superfamily enzyme YgiQ (UPF0313 family)
MTDVILINPRTQWDVKGITNRLPLACLYIGSVLEEHGFSVAVIDQRVNDQWAEDLHRLLRERPLWVGITSMTGRQIQWGLNASQIVRETDPSIPIVWGGVHPSILPEQTVSHLLVDAVAVGEGELTALELTQTLKERAGKPSQTELDLSHIDGLVWQSDGKIIRNQPRVPADMNQWPPLDYSLVQVDNYILSELPGERSLQMTTSRGCPMRCGYCYLGSVPGGRTYRAQDPERVVDHIERLMNSFEISAIHMIDDEFFTQFNRARKICRLIIERGIKVTLRANCRIDYINRFEDEDLQLFRKAGFKHIYLGAESGSDRMLQFIKKGITTEDIYKANEKLKRAGIAPKFSFMAGLPTETIKEVKATLKLMERLVRQNPEAYCTPVQLFSPYPGTPLFDYSLQAGMKMPSRLEQWGEWGLESALYSWLKPRENKLLEKIALFSFFLDGKTVPESATKSWFRFAARLYGAVVRLRVRLGFFAFMPEVAAIRWEYDNMSRRKDRERRTHYEVPTDACIENSAPLTSKTPEQPE